MASLQEFLAGGQDRTKRLNDAINEKLRYFLGPTGVDQRIGAVAELNPVNDIYQAGGDFRDGDYVGAATNTAAALVPVAGAAAAKPLAKTIAQGTDDAGRAIVDALTMYQTGGKMAAETVAERANQRGPVPDMHMFLGPKAKTADLDAMARAEKMLDAGASRDEVWKDTGWFRGVDGKMRFEIDDSNMINDIRGSVEEIGEGHPQPLDHMISHPEAFAAYPDLPQTPTRAMPVEWMNRQAQGAYGGVTEDGGLYLRSDVIDKGRPAHEIQHLIQRQEGFAGGGSPKDIGFDNYSRLAGEVEARNVENRVLFDANLRRENPPWTTQDVLDDDQIVMSGNKFEAGVPRNPANIRSRFARFDPRLKHLRNLSAGVGGLGLMLGYDQKSEEQALRDYLTK